VEIVVLQIFVSLALVLGSLVLLGVSTKQRDYEHADRLALLPIEDDERRAPRADADDFAPHTETTNEDSR
jgi:hypothetical protein